MRKLLKKYFIPHEENEHKPHALRKEVILPLVVFLLVIETAFLLSINFVFPKTDFLGLVIPTSLISLTNTDRTDTKINLLKESKLLTDAATLKAKDMAQKGYFAHYSPEGVSPWYWLNKVGYKYKYAGENLAINFFDSKDVNNAWMNSPAHKANILNDKYTEIGIGMANGVFEGRDTTFIVQFFGQPNTAKKITTTPKTIATTTVATTTVEAIPSVTQISTTSPNVPLEVKGAETSNVETFFSWLFSSVHNSLDWFYIAVALLLSVALLLNIFVKIKIQHPALIINALAIIFLVVAFLIFNQYAISIGSAIL